MEGALSVGTLRAEVEGSEVMWDSSLELFWFSITRVFQRVFYEVISPKHTAPLALSNGRHTWREFSLKDQSFWKIWTKQTNIQQFSNAEDPKHFGNHKAYYCYTPRGFGSDTTFGNWLFY